MGRGDSCDLVFKLILEEDAHPSAPSEPQKAACPTDRGQTEPE